MKRSSPGIARITVVVGLVAALVAAGVALLLTGDDTGALDVLLEPATSTGPDPFTDSVVTDAAEGAATNSPGRLPAGGDAPATVAGDTPGLYGGTGRQDECDVDQLVEFLTDNEEKGRAWAEVQGVEFDDLPTYLRSLSPAVLTVDTRVTNHGFRDGEATPRQSVLEAGTAVLVDERGVPRARCACGNPLLEPERASDTRTVGDPWDGYQAGGVVQVEPAEDDLGTLAITCPKDAGPLPAASGVLRLFVGRWSDVPVPSGFEVRTNVARVTHLVDSGGLGVAGNISFAPVGGGPATMEWAIVGNAVGSTTPGAPTAFPDGELATYSVSPATGTPDSTDPLALTVTVSETVASGTAANGMTFDVARVLEQDLAEEGLIPSEFTDLLSGIPGLDVPAIGVDDDTSGAGADAPGVECVTTADGDEPAPDDAPVGGDGSFTSYPGALPGTPSPNRVSLTIPAGGGPVTGTSEWAVDAGGGPTTVTGVWSGTYDAATHSLSGTAEITTTGPDGSVLGSGTADWTATLDPDTGVVSGTLESEDGPWEFVIEG